MMFVFSFNKKALKRTAFIILGLLLVFVVVAVSISSMAVPQTAKCDPIGEYNLSAKDFDGIKNFMLQFEYQSIEDTCEIKDITIPAEFNQVYSEYNNLQKKQGLDLSLYKTKPAKQYRFFVEKTKEHSTQEDSEASLYCVLIIYKDTVIGGHLETGLENCELLPLYS